MTQSKSVGQIQRSWWNRVVPVKIRHNIRLILGSIVVLSLVVVLLGSFQIRPIVFSEGEMLPTITNNVTGTVDFFDLSVPHSIVLNVTDIAYGQMISDFKRFDEKTFVEADAIIDGTFIGSVAIRLKGNSTLFGISGRGPGGPRPPAGTGPGGVTGATSGTPSGRARPGAGPRPPGGGIPPRMAAMMGGATADNPSTLPLLLSFDEFMPGRGYQGHTELAIRPISGGGASLNEALSLQLIRDSDQVTQKFTWTTFSINGDDSATRLVIENPNQNYASSLGLGRGVLYKSRNGNAFKYHGEDPTLYVEDFSQVSAVGIQDISPVIRLLAWLDTVSDEAFDAELADWIDIPSFAKYVVTQDLMDNFDDMAGPGRNFLLWYDLNDEKFTVITWDMNLVLVGMGDAFRGLLNMGSAPRLPGAPPSAAPPATPTVNVSTASGEVPSTLADSEPPTPSEDSEPGARSTGEPPGPAPSRRNIRFGNSLKDKFVASDAFAEDIANARVELLEFWFKSGLADQRLTELSKSVPVSQRLTQEQIDSQVAELKITIAETN